MQKQIVKVDTRLHPVEHYTFMALVALFLVMFIHAAFIAVPDSLRYTAALGWLTASLMTAALWRLVTVAQQLYMQCHVLYSACKQAGLIKPAPWLR